MPRMNTDPIFSAWEHDPEPTANERDPQTIVETGELSYIWNTQNEETGWLRFEGDTMKAKR